jgi:sulfotransferase famil protein
MISHSRRFIFIHIPRTSGTSIESALKRHGGIVRSGFKNFHSIYFKHAKAKSVQRMLGEEYDAYFRFTVVRNPWDWIVSNYEFNRGLHIPFVEGTGYPVRGEVPEWAKDQTFPDWFKWWIQNFSPNQSSMLVGKDGELLVEYIMRFENIEEDFRKLCRRIEVPYHPLTHEKKSTRKNFREYYDADLKRLVESHLSEDIQRFGYRFE